MRSLVLIEAAQFLGIHPDTLRERAAEGKIPGAKIGRQWRFLEADLIDYFRSQYREGECRSTSEAISGGSRFATAAEELDDLLARPMPLSRGDNTMNLKLVSGSKGIRAGRSTMRSSHGPKRNRGA